ncbi:hypothetical protein ANN_06790 [Periplaneta americana]|uniref:DDE Tnp4 domain-containing protein n=1 Tax=Periplaneta americana TaxID=6978 RepID=A0ABQ8TG76_PERAM|nr:hypothetical protein ANN_06790 [Periplaneta americana]
MAGLCEGDNEPPGYLKAISTDIVARWPGSTHDSTIFHESRLRALLETREIANGYLLGDGGYPCKSYLLTPLQNPGTRAEQRYNTAHKATHNTVERQYGVWKRRFPVLSMGLRCHLQNMSNIIVSTAVLHNIAIAARENLPPEDPEVNRILLLIRHQDEIPLQGNLRGNQQIPAVHLNYRDDDNPGQTTRRAVINRHFM